jgi:transposase
MSGPIPVTVRQAIFRRSQKGVATSDIAEEFRLSQRTVRHLLRQFRERGADACQTRYRHGPLKRSRQQQSLRKHVLSLRKGHPTWGAELLRVLLEDQYPAGVLPSARTFRRWLHAASSKPVPRGRRPDAERDSATNPHEVWQIDASEEIPLKGGRQACWLRVVDELTGAALGTWVFSPGALEFGLCRRSTRIPAFSVRNVGAACPSARGQWLSMGVARRPAHRAGALAVGSGN